MVSLKFLNIDNIYYNHYGDTQHLQAKTENFSFNNSQSFCRKTLGAMASLVISTKYTPTEPKN